MRWLQQMAPKTGVLKYVWWSLCNITSSEAKEKKKKTRNNSFGLKKKVTRPFSGKQAKTGKHECQNIPANVGVTHNKR